MSGTTERPARLRGALRRDVRTVVAVVATGLLAAGCASAPSGGAQGPGGTPGGGPRGGPGSAPPGVRLVAYDSCAAVLDGLQRAAARHVGPYGFAGPHPREGGVLALGGAAEGAAQRAVQPDYPGQLAHSGAPGSGVPGHSTTTVHEAGVDEADLVKTDGRRIVTVVDGVLRVIDASSKRLVGTLQLPGGAAQQLLMQGDRVLVVAPGGAAYGGGRVATPAPPMPVPGRPLPVPATRSRLTLVDLTGGPHVIGTLTVDGSYLDARGVDGVARVVVRSGTHLPFVQPDEQRSVAQARRENARIVAESSIDDWLPRYRLRSGGEVSHGRLVDCDRVSHAGSYSGSSMLSVLTLDLRGALSEGDPLAVLADGDTVYATGSSLYIAGPHPEAGRTLPGGAEIAPSPARRTVVHKFDFSGSSGPRYVASGAIDGSLLSQHALSEYGGYLRVATTSTTLPGEPPDRSGRPRSAVTVLAQHGGHLADIGRVGGLGEGERIYAVRFIGPAGYVVTFRETDPLYTLDLSDARRPRSAGKLKVTGYSAYLHPAGGGRLIGVGQEATARGLRLGTQLSLFDVNDPAAPRRVAYHHVRQAQSEVEFDPHAFLYWPRTGLIVLPVTRVAAVPLGAPDSDPPGSVRAPAPRPDSAALVLALRGGTIAELGEVRHPAGASAAYGNPVRRALVIGDTLWTLSAAGAMASDAGTLARLAWLPFPSVSR
ncbi:MAG: beta-propeller domain-containing protein [Carbonactinosporaceae bacterium]